MAVGNLPNVGGGVHVVVQKRRVNVCRCEVGPPFCVVDPECCTPVALTPCCPNPLPATLHVTATSHCAGGCTVTVPVTWNAGLARWLGSIPTACSTGPDRVTTAQVFCNGDGAGSVTFTVSVGWATGFFHDSTGTRPVFITCPCVGPYSGTGTAPVDPFGAFGTGGGACAAHDVTPGDGTTATVTLTV